MFSKVVLDMSWVTTVAFQVNQPPQLNRVAHCKSVYESSYRKKAPAEAVPALESSP